MFDLFYQYVICACHFIILDCRSSFSVFFLGEWISDCSTVVRIGRFDLVDMFPLPLKSSCGATWLALTKHGGVGIVGSLEIVFHAFRLLCVRSIHSFPSSALPSDQSACFQHVVVYPLP